MSGLISTGLGIANGIRSAISTGVGIITGISTEIGSLFGGDGPILLGDVTFDGHAVPPHMKWGGQQALAVHKLPGGQRVIDAMGRDDAVLEWSATFVADDAGDQAFAIDQMRIDGTPVPLIWGDHYYVVIVQMFEPSDQHQTIIPYKIACMVVQDMSQPPGPDFLSTILAVYADVNAAIGFVSGLLQSFAGTDLFSAPLYAAQVAIVAAQPSGLALGAATTLAAVLALQGAYDALVAAQQAADGQLELIVLAAPVGSVVATTGALSAAVAAAGASAQLSAAQGFLGRALLGAQAGTA